MDTFDKHSIGSGMARAIIADDHPLFRAALKQALLETLVAPILEVASFEQLLQVIAKSALFTPKPIKTAALKRLVKRLLRR